MKFIRILTTTSAVAMLAGPAIADLTAEQVLADQLSQMTMSGLKAETVGQSRSGDTLKIESLVLSGDMPEGSLTVIMGGAQYTEQDDGTVVMTYPATIPISVKVTGGDEEFEMAATIIQSGTQSIVSGTPETIRYDFVSQEFRISNVAFLVPAEAAELDMNLEFSLSGIVGLIELGSGTVRDYSADLTVDAITMLIDATAPDGEKGDFHLEFVSKDLITKYAGSFAAQDFGGSLATAIMNGNSAGGTARYGPATYSIAVDSPDGSIDIAAAAGGGDISFSMGKAGIDYSTNSDDITTSVGGSAIPLPPMTFKIAESGVRFAIPIIPGEDLQNFALRMSMVGLEVDPTLWGMIDPSEKIPRGPATLVIDMDGEVVLTEDIFDPEFAEAEMTAPPGQINSLNVNELRFSIAGAELTGDAEFAFNNDMGMPVPAGVANLMLVGGNGLLDTLVALGLVPKDQAVGARMMMGMFTRPGSGDDALVSTIEVNEDGSILANGQRIK